MSAFSQLVVAAAESGPIRKTVTESRAGRSLARRFVAGDTLDDAVRVARSLNQAGMKVSLDLLGEEVSSVTEVGTAVDGYVDCLDAIASESIDGNISIKLTQLGLAFDLEVARAGLDRLAVVASDHGLTVTIDMEDSSYTSATVDLYGAAQKTHGNLGLAIQAYLHRSPQDLATLIPLGGHIRLCKGAYLESSEVALTSRAEVDAAFARLLHVLMASGSTTPAIATHDPRLIDLTRHLARQRSEPFEFQMLYGIRSQAQRELAAAGYPIRVYVPYGSHWYPYLVRRLAERPANLAFFLRAVVGR
ncbi:MAG: proline dehydrogenase family protein [Acidimicrobiia bacterium]